MSLREMLVTIDCDEGRKTFRSSVGKKLYAVRDSKSRFKDIQTYDRLHRANLKKKGKK